MILGYKVPKTLDTEFGNFICVPIERGGLFGVVGNGMVQIWGRSIMRDGKPIPENWFKQIDAGYLATIQRMKCAYFTCLTCVGLV